VRAAAGEVIAALDRGKKYRTPRRCMMLNNQPFIENKDAGAFAQAIVDPVREPLLVLDKDPGVRGVLFNFQ
jgi:hypothetical protein